MRYGLPLTICLWLITAHAQAFVLDGFFSGMTKGLALEKLREERHDLKQPNPLADPNAVEAGAYYMEFCKDKLYAINKTIDFKEFNSYLLSMLKTHGNPNVGIPSFDADILHLRWKTNDGEYALNSGVNSKGERFHNLGVLDNSVCQSN